MLIKNSVFFLFLIGPISGKHTGLSDIRQDFAREMVNFLTLRKENPLSPVTTERRVIHLKAFLDYAVEREWLDKNRVQHFEYNPKSKKVVPLEYVEVMQLHAAGYESPKLNIIKDLFIFQCFTGFAYIELANLTQENLIDHGGRGKCLMRNRQKSDATELVPVLPIVEEIIERYREHEVVLRTGSLLPVISNQKYNDYLKPVGVLAGFARPLTTHLARHTFAHMMLNHFFLPLEDVSLMLGHRSIKTTHQYCQVGKERLMKSMQMVQGQMDKVIEKVPLLTNRAS
ncbi:site-specific integrase [Pedobacter sp. SL55]|uniref:site-specific integrase n=1 Tax=Pedobacter sp. SL55 TaxID=2995161 RepID=UPI002270DD12|nr:site-specific integrase [Pedobacter sp. SL55]WAC41636.1 tyrosine-type recombinase/integrase [Pedobacter sp. SL55]